MSISGSAFRKGQVPLSILAAKLKSLQSLLFHAAATAAHDRGARRGLWFNKYLEGAELTLASVHLSDLVIEAEVATPDSLGPELDWSGNALDILFNAARCVNENPDDIERVITDRQERALFMRAMENLCPAVGDEYQVSLENCAATHPRVVLSPGTRPILRRAIARDMGIAETEREVTIVGTLIKIHIDVGPQKIAVLVAPGTEIECYYDDALRDQISNLLAGCTVEVTGTATLDINEKIKQIDSISGVEMVSMEPLRMTHFEYEGKRYRLREPLLVTVEHLDGVWVYNSTQINLWGYAARREDALNDLAANFDYLWQQFAVEEDAALDEKALAIKRRLLHIVESLPRENN
jgi:hypothetical protein